MQESGKWASDLEGRGALCMCSKSPNVGSWDRFMGHGRHATENTWLVLKYWPGEDRGMLQTEDQTDATAPRWKQAKHRHPQGAPRQQSSASRVAEWGCTWYTALQAIPRDLGYLFCRVWEPLKDPEGGHEFQYAHLESWESSLEPGQALSAASPGVSDASRAEAVEKKKKRQENDFWLILKTNIYWDLEPEVIKVVLKLRASQKVWGEMQVLFFFVDVINFRVLKHVQ